ncbi:MAG: serine hydrolase [Xanthobacteraceae bacterium]|nr:serine hydrolase [Xanthobacteraceae bacterium]
MRHAFLVTALVAGLLQVTLPGVRAQSLPSAAPETVGLSGERLARIAKVFGAEVDQGRLPGAVVAVARRGKLVYFEALGYQDKPAGKAMQKDSIFRVYSMTKPWTSVAAMMLVEDGRIQLPDPISKFLPAFKGQSVSVATANGATGQTTYDLVPAAREPTVQDLLRHTSGIAYDFVTRNAPVKDAYEKSDLKAVGVEIRDKLTAADFVERLARAPLASQPGTQWEYSLSTALLGRVVEAVSGKPLSKFLEERLFAPLGMTESGFLVPGDKAGRIAQPLLPHAFTMFDPTVPPANDLGGEGGMSTAMDYLRFCQMLLDGGKFGDARVLSRSTLALMTSDHLGARPSSPVGPGELLLGVPGYTFGLGFMVRTGAGIAGVPGSPGEYMWGGAGGTFFWVDPKEELAVVLMSQAPFASRVVHRRLVKQLVYAAIID